MAKVMYARLCKKIKRDKQTGSYALIGSFAALPWTDTPTSFVLVVYWSGANETFQQTFAITDADGNLLDQTPTTECVLRDRRINISTAFFHAAFPRSGYYSINVFQNGVCIESIPLPVIEAEQTVHNPEVAFSPLTGPTHN